MESIWYIYTFLIFILFPNVTNVLNPIGSTIFENTFKKLRFTFLIPVWENKFALDLSIYEIIFLQVPAHSQYFSVPRAAILNNDGLIKRADKNSNKISDCHGKASTGVWPSDRASKNERKNWNEVWEGETGCAILLASGTVERNHFKSTILKFLGCLIRNNERNKLILTSISHPLKIIKCLYFSL